MRELYDPRLVEEESEAGASRLRAGTRPAWGPRHPRTVRGCISRPRLAPHAHGHLDSSRRGAKALPPRLAPHPPRLRALLCAGPHAKGRFFVNGFLYL